MHRFHRGVDCRHADPHGAHARMQRLTNADQCARPRHDYRGRRPSGNDSAALVLGRFPRKKIEEWAIDASFVISFRWKKAPAAYKTFRDKEDGCTTVILKT